MSCAECDKEFDDFEEVVHVDCYILCKECTGRLKDDMDDE